MMTNGPETTVGQVLEIPFERPRTRAEVLDHPHYYDFRVCLISFLEKQEHRKTAHVASYEERQADEPNAPVEFRRPSVQEPVGV